MKQGHSKTRAKHYFCLFIYLCLTTHAVHLEMSNSLDTHVFISAFTWPTSRRGIPTYVISDNGLWPLVCKMEAYPGDDGLVRVVKDKAKNKEYLYPVHHLCPLEYAEDNAKG